MFARFATSLVRVVSLAMLLGGGTASAATVTSNSGFGLDWSAPATWQGGQVPASGDHVVIGPGSSVTIAAAATVSVNSLTVQGGTSVSPSQSGSLTIDGTLTVTSVATAQGGTPGGAANITVNGTLNAGAVNINGGAGDASGTGGAATLSLNANTAAVNIGGGLSVTVVNGAFTGGAATVNFPATGGVLDVDGDLNVTSGTLNLSNGSVELAGDFIGDYLETINAGASTITLDGAVHQHWIGNSHNLWNLTVTNASAEINWDFVAVTLDSDVTVDGMLTLSGGILYNSFNLAVSQVNGLTHTSGHISGSLVRNVAGATPAFFPVGTDIPLFATVTPSSSGLLQVLAYQGIAWGAGANAIDAYWELIGDPSLTNLDAVTFNYGGTTVTGNETAYVIARQDYTATPAMWQRYPTTLNTTTDVASMATNTPLLGYWTIAEPSSVTTATQIVLSSLNYGLPTRKNTPFDLVYEARDGQNNPAVFSQYTSFELNLGPSAPGPTGTLTDIDSNTAPIGADANAGDRFLYINNLLYTAAETVNLQLSEANVTPTFATLATPVTFAVPATGITITSSEDDGPGTLRHAIHTVNSGGCSTMPCPVDFQLPAGEQLGDGTWSIEIQSSPFLNSTVGISRIAGEPLPSIFSAMTIDATTQSGYNPANPKPVVAIDFNGGNGLIVDGSGTTIRGLALHHASDQAITLQGLGNHIVQGCYLGLYATGSSDNDTATGIAVTSDSNTIGGTTPAQRNVISGNWFGGIELLAGAANNQILGNYIGTDPAGTTAVPNFNGIVITSASDNRIGGAQAGAGNVIAGNDSDGILIDGTSGNNNFASAGAPVTNIVINNAAENKIEGNSIGFDASGAELLNSYAISVQGDGALDNVIGGPSAGQGNLIAGGIHLGSNSLGTAVLGNTTDITAEGILISGFAGNDPGDGDVNVVACAQQPCVYANNGQNTPEITSASLVSTTLQVTATVDSSAVASTQSIRIEVFAADANDTLTFIGNGCYNTNFPASVSINIPNAPVAAGDAVYATATSFTTTGCAINDQAGNHLLNDGTSQFSAPATVSACTGTTPTITASGSTSFCSGGSVTLSSTTASSYSWKKNGVALNVFSQQLVVSTSGNYSVEVTDGNGCPAESAATTVTVFANPSTPSITADSATTFCQGGSVVLRTTPGAASYQWFHNNAPVNGATSDAFTATVAGNYTVAASNANGCSATSSAITVTVNPAPSTPTISASGPTTFCSGGNVVLTSSAATTYQWLLNGSPIQNATAQTFTATATGNYSVVAGNGSCTATSAPIAVTVNPAPATPTVTPSGPTSFCTGGSVTLTSSPATTYQWLLNGSPIQNATAQTFTATATGNYSVVAGNGSCTATSAPITVTVNPAPATPTVTPSGPTSFCTGGSVTLTSSPAATYQWLLNGSPIQNATAQTFTATATGNYSVVAGNGSCTATSAPTAVTVNPAPATPTVTPSGPTSFCTGGSVTLTSSPATTYQWLLNGSPIQNATAQTFTATATGNYSVVAGNGSCTATSAPTAVTVNPAPSTPTISASGPTTFCTGGSVTLTSSPATTYQWLLNGSPIQNATAQTFTATATGNYSVVAGNGSCTATSAPTAVTVNPAPATPTVTPSGPTTFCTGGSVTLTSSPAASYQWLLNGGPIPNATAQTFTATATGNYSVTVFNANSCSATSTVVTVTVNAPPATPSVTPNGPTTFCQGGSVILSSTAASAYQWLLDGSPIQNATGQTFTASATGNYSVVVGSGSCTATSTPVAVTVQSTATPTVTASGPTTFCQGGSVTLTASATSGTYQWLKNGTPINGANAQTLAATVTGNYTVTVTENNCPATSAPVSVTATPFTPTLNAPSTTICPSGSVTLSASAGTGYQWYFNHQPINGATSQTYPATQPGDYKVYVENNGCSNFSAPVTLTAANVTTPTITASGPTTFCEGGQVTLTSTAAQSYQWNRNGTPIPNATQQTYPAATSGSYTVTTMSGGCPATSAPVAVTANPNPFFTILAPASVTPGSSGNTASIDSVQGGVSYSWSITGGTIDGPTTGTSITFTANANTVVLTVVATLNGCTSTQTRQIATAATFADLSVTKSAPSSVEAGAVIDYTIVATNHGPAAAASVYLTDVLPAGTVYIHADSSWPCAFVSGSVVCRTALLPAGGSETIHLTVTAPRQAGTITNSVSINSDIADPSMANNDAAATTIVTAPAPTCATAPPSLITPASGASVTSPATFSWTAVTGATTYELWTIAGTATTLAGTTASTSLSVNVPSGTVTWYVIARLAAGCDALVSAQRTITVAQSGDCSTNGTAQLTAPAANSTTGSPVTFAWTAVPNATGYRVWVSVDGGPAQDIASTTGATSVTAAVPPGIIAASVETLFSGCPSTRSSAITFTVPKPDPCATRTVATPVAPSNNATIQSSSIDFRWTAAAGAKEYRLWAAIDGGAPAVLGTTTATELRATIARGEVLWWVESLYAGCASTESQRFRFTIPAAQNCGTARPDTLAPANGATTGTGTITFTWSAVGGAIGYELWLAHNDGTPALIGTTTATSLTAEVPAGTLQWFVRVLVDRCPPRDSQTARFTYLQPAGCDTNVRPAPVSPVDRAQAVSPVGFSWGTSAGATRYELYVARGNGAPSLAATTAAGQADGISLANGSIRWFVRAHFGANCPPLDSAEQQLEIVPRPDACAVPNAPVLSAPGQITSGTPFRIQWSPDPAATAYHLQISSREDFAGAELITTTATEHDLLETNSASAPVAIYARVRAVNARCATSPVSAFGSAIAVFILPPSVIDGGATATDRGQVRYTIPIGAELAGQSFVATSAQPFITFQPASGIVPAGGMNLVILVDTSSLPSGTTLGSVTLSFSTPGAGRIAANATTVTTPISVNLVSPVTPTPKNTPPPDALIIPAVAHANGINSQFQSDIRVSNTSPQLIKYQLTFTPSGDAGISAGRQTTFSIDPGRTVALDDVLKSWFGTGTQSVTGTLEVRPLTQTATSTSGALVGALANLNTFASSRTFNVTPNGTFGQYIPAIPFANFIGKSGAVLSLQQIAQSSKYRTNLGLVEGSGESASLLVKVFGANGAKLTEFPVSLNGGQHLQLNAVLATRNLGNVDDGRIEVQVTGGNGKVTAYASVLDNQTSDPLLVTPVTLGDAGNTKWVVPGVADLSNGAANWQSDIRLFNAGQSSVDATLSFHSMNGGAPKTATITLQPGEVRQLDRALSSVFGVAQDGGALHIETASAARLIATARTYNQTSLGTYGQFISAVTPAESVAVGSRPLQLLQVEESTRYRSNIGLAEVTGKPVTLEVSVVPPDSKFTATTRVTLAANEFRQITSMLASLGLGETYNARVTVRAVSGEGRATAYASVIDLKTQDPTYVPAQ